MTCKRSANMPKITVYEFIQEVSRDLKPFADNMVHFSMENRSEEEWGQMFTAWCEWICEEWHND